MRPCGSRVASRPPSWNSSWLRILGIDGRSSRSWAGDNPAAIEQPASSARAADGRVLAMCHWLCPSASADESGAIAHLVAIGDRIRRRVDHLFQPPLSPVSISQPCCSSRPSETGRIVTRSPASTTATDMPFSPKISALDGRCTPPACRSRAEGDLGIGARLQRTIAIIGLQLDEHRARLRVHRIGVAGEHRIEAAAGIFGQVSGPCMPGGSARNRAAARAHRCACDARRIQ